MHLAPDDAATLFELIQASYAGRVPRFAYDLETQTRSNHGDFMRNRQGELKMADGYRVLIMIEDYSGEDVTSEDGAAALF